MKRVQKIPADDKSCPQEFGAEKRIWPLSGAARKTVDDHCFVGGRARRPAQISLLASPQILKFSRKEKFLRTTKVVRRNLARRRGFAPLAGTPR